MQQDHPDYPKRPTSAYLKFAQEQSARIRAKDPNLPTKEIAKKVGKRWQKLDEEAKVFFCAIP